jgi:hypothetical protein
MYKLCIDVVLSLLQVSGSLDTVFTIRSKDGKS